MKTTTAETITVYKAFAMWNFEKEEEWLNGMAQDGWALKKVGYCKYVFERSEPGEYIIRLEMHDADEQYMELMRESGAEYVGSVLQWLYFRKKAELGEFELFSDIDSRIGHLKSISWTMLIIGGGNVLIGLTNLANGSAGYINLLCACVVFYELGRIHGKKDELERERRIRE